MTIVSTGGLIADKAPVEFTFFDPSDLPGNADNFISVQAAIDSQHAVFVLSKNFSLTSPLVISKPKSITCETPRMRTGFKDTSLVQGEVYPDTPLECTRFLIEHGSDAIVFDSEDIHWWGGTIDTQPTPTFGAGVFLVKAQPNRIGCSIEQVEIMGARSQCVNNPPGAGISAIKFDFASGNATDGIFNFYCSNVEIRGASEAFYAEAKGAQQFSYWHRIEKFQFDWTQRSIYDLSSEYSWFSTLHQGREIFQSVADANLTPSIQFDVTSNYVDLAYQGDYDLGSAPTRNSRSFLLNARTNINDFTRYTYGFLLALPNSSAFIDNGMMEVPVYNHRNYQRTQFIVPDIDGTQFSSATSRANTFGKRAGSIAMNTTDGRRLYVARGPLPTDPWNRWDGANTIIPS